MTDCDKREDRRKCPGSRCGREGRCAEGLSAVIAAVALGDRGAADRWGAQVEAATDGNPGDEAARVFARLLLSGVRTDAALAQGRSARDGFAAATYPGHPNALVMDLWIAGLFPPPAVRP